MKNRAKQSNHRILCALAAVLALCVLVQSSVSAYVGPRDKLILLDCPGVEQQYLLSLTSSLRQTIDEFLQTYVVNCDAQAKDTVSLLVQKAHQWEDGDAWSRYLYKEDILIIEPYSDTRLDELERENSRLIVCMYKHYERIDNWLVISTGDIQPYCTESAFVPTFPRVNDMPVSPTHLVWAKVTAFNAASIVWLFGSVVFVAGLVKLWLYTLRGTAVKRLRLRFIFANMLLLPLAAFLLFSPLGFFIPIQFIGCLVATWVIALWVQSMKPSPPQKRVKLK